ncbi:hypothetical protein [Marinobacter sp.]|uniref:hypothetical protein n=1 Tax=Marinobacter sp. TaxID=50741 RepID=UPI001999000F|nr:hypothetical protein [Marinobacter sp.]MBC7192789.1 hypothetical protein [Marinobacter sp.]
MKRRNGKFNPKRKLQQRKPDDNKLEELLKQVKYGGNPEHKRNPGDFGLTPPSDPRPHKSLCDDCGIVSRNSADSLLTEGLSRGLVSVQQKEQWPQNIWAVTSDGHVVEAQLENVTKGTYHGYPMPESDPFREVVVDAWEKAEQHKAGRDDNAI